MLSTSRHKLSNTCFNDSFPGGTTLHKEHTSEMRICDRARSGNRVWLEQQKKAVAGAAKRTWTDPSIYWWHWPCIRETRTPRQRYWPSNCPPSQRGPSCEFWGQLSQMMWVADVASISSGYRLTSRWRLSPVEHERTVKKGHSFSPSNDTHPWRAEPHKTHLVHFHPPQNTDLRRAHIRIRRTFQWCKSLCWAQQETRERGLSFKISRAVTNC